jgi:hypothetical protein
MRQFVFVHVRLKEDIAGRSGSKSTGEAGGRVGMMEWRPDAHPGKTAEKTGNQTE